MWEHLASFIANSWEAIAPFIIVKQYEKGIILRVGKFNRKLSPGLHFKLPIVEALLTVESVQTTMLIQPQTLTTKDGVTIMTSGALQYEITDAKIFLLDVYEARDAVRDTVLMEVKKTIQSTTWDELGYPIIDNKLTLKIRRRLKDYGVHVKRFGFIDIGRIKTLRLITGNGDHDESWT